MNYRAEDMRVRAADLLRESKACKELARAMEDFTNKFGVEVTAMALKRINPVLVTNTVFPVLESVTDVGQENAQQACSKPPARACTQVSMGHATQHLIGVPRPHGWRLAKDCEVIHYITLGWDRIEIACALGVHPNFITERVMAMRGRCKASDTPAFTLAELQAA